MQDHQGSALFRAFFARCAGGTGSAFEVAVPLKDPTAGYALVDAIVALLILSLALVFSLQATHQARAAAVQAWEVRRANTLLAHLVEMGPKGEDSDGISDGFTWRIETRTTGAEQPVAICRRHVILKSEATKRSYELATLAACPQDGVG